MDQKELADLDLKEIREQREILGNQEPQVPMEKMVQRVIKALPDQREFLATKDPKDHLEMTAVMAKMAKTEVQDHRVILVNLDHLDQKVLQDHLDLKDQLENLDHPEKMVPKETKVILVQRVMMVHQENLVKMVMMVLTDLEDHLDHREHQEKMEKTEQTVNQDLKDHPDLKDQLVIQDPKVTLDQRLVYSLFYSNN